jgi:hypothetical protein
MNIRFIISLSGISRADCKSGAGKVANFVYTTHTHTHTHAEGQKRCIVTKLAFWIQIYCTNAKITARSQLSHLRTRTHAQTHAQIKTGERLQKPYPAATVTAFVRLPPPTLAHPRLASPPLERDTPPLHDPTPVPALGRRHSTHAGQPH